MHFTNQEVSMEPLCSLGLLVMKQFAVLGFSPHLCFWPWLERKPDLQSWPYQESRNLSSCPHLLGQVWPCQGHESHRPERTHSPSLLSGGLRAQGSDYFFMSVGCSQSIGSAEDEIKYWQHLVVREEYLLQRVGHDWATSLSLFTFMHWRRKWQPAPVLLPGESQGRGSLVVCHLRGRTESDTTEAT